jgi:hypothetical protein
MAKIIVFLYHMNVCPSEVSASLALTALLDWNELFGISFLFQLYLTVSGKGSAKTSCSCWKDTVEHVNSLNGS